MDPQAPWSPEARENLAVRPVAAYDHVVDCDEERTRDLVYFHEFSPSPSLPPAAARMVGLLEDWQRAHRAPEGTTLRYLNEGRAVLDSRFGASAEVELGEDVARVLDGRCRITSLACMEKRYVAERQAGWRRLEDALRYLEEARLVVIRGGEAVSLVLDEHVPRRTEKVFPGGQRTIDELHY